MSSNTSSTSPDTALNVTLAVPFDIVPTLDEELKRVQKKVGKYNFEFRVLKIPTVINFRGREINGIEYMIQTEAPIVKYKGYQYAATLKKETVDSDKHLVHAAANMKGLDLSGYRDVEFRCDHCGHKRYRKTVHVFRNLDGSELIVAQSCAKAYFGIDIERTLKKIVRYFELDILHNMLSDYVYDPDNVSRGWISKYQLVPTDKNRMCGLLFGILLQDGSFISRRHEQHGEISTALKAIKLYKLSGLSRDSIMRDELLSLAAKKNYNYADIRRYWQEKKDNSDFTHNIRTNFDMIQPKAGILAYAVWEYIKENVLPKRKKFLDYESNHVGTVGTKVSGSTTIIGIKKGAGHFGAYTIIRFVDDEENLFTWFNNGNPPEVEIGQKVKFRGTLKKHDVYKGQKVNLLKRVKLEA